MTSFSLEVLLAAILEGGGSRIIWNRLDYSCAPTAFLVHPIFPLFFYNSIETRYMFSISYLESFCYTCIMLTIGSIIIMGK